MMRKTVLGTMALAVGLLARGAWAATTTGPFADLDGDGVFSAGDVPLGKALGNDGVFDATRADAGWKPMDGIVNVVFPARYVSKKRVLVVKTNGDITVHGSLGAAGNGGVIVLLSTGGAVHVDGGLRLTTDSVLQLIGMGNVDVGDRVQLYAKSGDFSMVSIASQAGDVTIGSNVQVGAQGLVEITTGDATGGVVQIGPGSRVASGGGSARLTAGNDVSLTGIKVSAQNVLIGSHASPRTGRAGAMGPGYAAVRDSMVKAPHGQVHIFADGSGGTIDVTKTALQASSRDEVTLDADIIVR
jgi:hypothetical protein